MKFLLKNTPKLKLGDLLRRRKSNLKQFLHEFGITTYEGLVSRCVRMGVNPPHEDEFKKTLQVSESPILVNNPQEGVVVLEPPPIIKENTGQKIEPRQESLDDLKSVNQYDSSAAVEITSSSVVNDKNTTPPTTSVAPTLEKLQFQDFFQNQKKLRKKE